MSHRPDDDDSPLDEGILRALASREGLLPTSEAQVEQAESALPPELELPVGLQRYRDRERAEPRATPRPLGRLHVAGYALATALGGLAAAAALSWLRPTTTAVTSAGGELIKPNPSGANAAPLALHGRCERECCAGSSCKSAPSALASCPSGIGCVACSPDNAHGGPYRLRLGSMIVTDTGQKLLPNDAPLELCVVGASSDVTCIPALSDPGNDAWRQLKAVTPLQDLLTGLTVELRKRGENQALASWRHAVSPSTEVLCKGLMIQLNDGTETLGRLSAFIEPTHFLELARASTVPELLAARRRFELHDIQARIFESAEPGLRRFALVLGPLERQDAEELRWQVLDRGLEANIGLGLDFIGSPRPGE